MAVPKPRPVGCEWLYPGIRVRVTPDARKRGVHSNNPEGRQGTVKSVVSTIGMVRVRWDGNTTDDRLHHSFLEPAEDAKGVT